MPVRLSPSLIYGNAWYEEEQLIQITEENSKPYIKDVEYIMQITMCIDKYAF